MNEINFGGYWFSGPEPVPPSCLRGAADAPGLYVILALDTGWGPRPFRPLYIGESGGVAARATSTHENFLSWCAATGFTAPVYRALCPLPGWTKYQRQLGRQH